MKQSFWRRTAGVTLVTHYLRLALAALSIGLLFSFSAAAIRPAVAAPNIILGAVRSDLYLISDQEFQRVRQAVREGPFTSLRNRLATSYTIDTIPRDAKRNATRMAVLQSDGITSFLVPLQPARADYDLPLPWKHPGVCGRDRGVLPYSQVNLAKYRKRLANNLREMKKHGVNVVAFEIGNEINTACFNGDVPARDRAFPPTPAEILHVVAAYAEVIKAAVETVHMPEFYPEAKIISAGFAGPRAVRYNGHNIPHPGRIIDALRRIPYGAARKRSVFDLLDGIGVHYYARATAASIDGVKLVLQDFERDTRANGKPYWITEWFAGNRTKPGGRNLYGKFKQFYRAATHASVPVAAMYVMNIGHSRNPGYDMVDADFNYYPDIRFFRETIPPTLSLKVRPVDIGVGAPGRQLVWKSHNVVPHSCALKRNDGTDAEILVRAEDGVRAIGHLQAPSNFSLTCETYSGRSVSSRVTVPPN